MATVALVSPVVDEPIDENKYNYYRSDGAVSWDAYEKLRPPCPQAIFDVIKQYMKRNNHTDRSLCVDYGSGSGVILPMIFDHLELKKVLCNDRNERQLHYSNAKWSRVYGEDRIDTLVGFAGSLSTIEDASVDLVTTAQSCHYFNRPKWLMEVARILKRSGTFAIWNYHPQSFILSHPDAAEACNRAWQRLFDLNFLLDKNFSEGLVLSATRFDSLVVESDILTQQERYKWHLPTSISEKLSWPAEFGTSYPGLDDAVLRAGLLANPDTRMEEFVPDTSASVLVRDAYWTTSTIIQYMRTLGTPHFEDVLLDRIFQQAVNEIESVVGGPNGTFEVGWVYYLMLATRP